MQVICLVKREDTAQTLESVNNLPDEVILKLADYTLTLPEFIHCMNIANELTDRNLNGECRISKEFKELAEEVMDCITCGEYFVVRTKML